MMKDQKGITLVALIITIIVMLILVAVTISVALQGGLFDNARRANSKTIEAQIKEAMVLAKAEVMADYYADGTEVNADIYADKVEGYLDEKYKDKVVASYSGNDVSVTVDGTSYGTFTAVPGMNTSSN